MQKDSLPTRILKIILAVLVTVLAVSALAAVTALLLYGLVLAAVALVLLFILSPEDLRAFVKAAGERIDGWIGRLEGLWRSVKEVPQKQTEARADEYAFTLGLIYELGE